MEHRQLVDSRSQAAFAVQCGQLIGQHVPFMECRWQRTGALGDETALAVEPMRMLEPILNVGSTAATLGEDEHSDTE